jgi:ribosome-associated translation inhibitor RaiA
MHVAVQYKCDEFRSQIEQDLARFGAKLERWLEHYDSDLVSLHACYDKHARKRTYLIILNLTLPGTKLHASASNIEARFALRRAFDEMEMQISKHQRRARKDYQWKRKRLRRPTPAEVEA